MNQSSYLESLFSLSGKVAVVIGGTGELCGAMAEGLAGAGAEVVLVGRNLEKAKARLTKIAAAGGTGWFHAAEASSKAETRGPARRRARAQRQGRHRGQRRRRQFRHAVLRHQPRRNSTASCDVNLKGVFLGCQVFGKYLVERGQGGSIINLGSMSGVVPLSRVFTYSATKGAVHNLSLNLAREWAPHRVRVNVLVPGFFPAEQNRKMLSPDRVASIMGHTPMKRFGEARELIGATLLLASDAAGSFITGEELIVDGGYHAMTI